MHDRDVALLLTVIARFLRRGGMWGAKAEDVGLAERLEARARELEGRG
jgi:hypothetical protein